ncbi:MAG: CoA transferase [Ilumatobacteraceae bacterium]|nr:CoA transferase [Ilumatobacteraceae bacterium]
MSIDHSQGPLTGIRVVDMSVMISGPLAGMTLADQGAEVFKVESPGLGDMMRYLGSQKNGITGIYALHNRGKKSLVVDLKKPEGTEVLRSLVATADVLIQNFRPGAVERLGFGYEDVRAINPDIVYVSIAGFGADGPSSNRRVYDNVIQAASGLASVQTDAATGKPAIFKHLICDKVTAYTVAQAITAALFARERGAGGQHITISMLDAAIAFTWPDCAMDVALLDEDALRTATISSAYSAMEFKDGYATSSVVTQSEFEGYCAALGVPEVAQDERFKDREARAINAAALKEILQHQLSTISVHDFLEGALIHDVPASGLNTLATVVDDPQVIHNETFFIREHPQAGTMREVRNAPRFKGTPTKMQPPAPAMGAHSDEIVSSLGLDAAALRAAAIIF